MKTAAPLRSINYDQDQPFAQAGENLTFDRSPAESWCFPRTHLIHAQCEGEQLEFRFPLYVVHVTASGGPMLLDQIVQGDVCVLFVRDQFSTKELTRSYFNEVNSITVHPLFEGRFA